MSEPELITHNESPMLSAEDRARKLHDTRVERVKDRAESWLAVRALLNPTRKMLDDAENELAQVLWELVSLD